MTVDGEHLDRWLAGKGFSSNTRAQRVRLSIRLDADWTTLDVPDHRIASWLSQYQGWSRRTYHSHLISIYDWLVETGQVESNRARAIKRTPCPRPRPRPLTEHDLTRALAAADQSVRAYLMLGYLAGLRAHEIAKFAAEDITEVHIYVYGKGGQGEMVPTHPLLWDLAHEMPQCGYWFISPRLTGAPIQSQSVTRAVTKLFRSIGLTGSSHRARHTFGTHLLRGGANLRVVQDLMRHKSLATTALYLGVDEDERRSAIASLAA